MCKTVVYQKISGFYFSPFSGTISVNNRQYQALLQVLPDYPQLQDYIFIGGVISQALVRNVHQVVL